MPPLREPIDGPSDRPVKLGGAMLGPGPVVPLDEGGDPVLCAHTTCKEMAIPIASPAQLRILMLIRMRAPPFR